jgi:hypothetical protein
VDFKGRQGVAAVGRCPRRSASLTTGGFRRPDDGLDPPCCVVATVDEVGTLILLEPDTLAGPVSPPKGGGDTARRTGLAFPGNSLRVARAVTLLMRKSSALDCASSAPRRRSAPVRRASAAGGPDASVRAAATG